MENNNHPTDLSSITAAWFKACNIKVSNRYLNDSLTTHPDYPALTSLTDFLEIGGMEYDAVKADASYIHEFNYPLLAHIKQPGNEYLYTINDVTEWDKQKNTTQHWSGVVLYASKGTTWQNNDNNTALQQEQKNKLLATAFVILGIALFTASVFIFSNTIINIFGFLSLVGLAISIAALGTELGYQSKLVKQVCGTVGNGGCEKVLTSKFAKGFAGITPADASIIYFTTQFTLYLIACFYNPIFTGIITISLAGIAIASWSLYTQAVILKEWCALCLGIVAVLLSQLIIGALQYNRLQYNLLAQSFIIFAVSVLVLSIIYFPLKQLIKSNTKNLQDLATLKKWKSDVSLFMTQWEKEASCDNSIWENDLIIGNPKAPIRITVACNPYCGPCAKTHKELDNLFDNYPSKISIQLRLLCNPTNIEDKRTIAVKAILQQASILKNNNELQHMLSDWFEHMDIAVWQKKWNKKNEIDVTNMLLQHEWWNNETGITHTPTIFINGKKIPGRYTLNDIEKMIPQLTESFTEV